MPESGLWRFSVALYARRGVEALCLRLQDRHGVDIAMALFCLHSGLTAGRLTPASMAAAAALSRDWRREAVEPARRLRRALKPRVAALERAGLAATAFREQVKALELAAEQTQLQALAPLAQDAAPPPGAEAATANWRAWRGEAWSIDPIGDLDRDWAALLAAALEQRSETP